MLFEEHLHMDCPLWDTFHAEAETEGFEPSSPFGHTCFRDRLLTIRTYLHFTDTI